MNSNSTAVSPERDALAAATKDNEEDETFFSQRSGLGAPYLLRESPIWNQAVLKLHVPFLFRISPSWLQKFICRVRFFQYYFTAWVRPRWVPRYLILLGGFLYRYKDEYSSGPKGTPIALEQIRHAAWLGTNTTATEETRHNEIMDELQYAFQPNARSAVIPFGFHGIFSVESSMTLPTKVQYYAVPTGEDAQMWVNSLLQARQESITRSMGHSKVPVPNSWQYFDKLAIKFIRRKESIKARSTAHQRQDFEMASMMMTQPYTSSSEHQGMYT
jgi:hypothetical protein